MEPFYITPEEFWEWFDTLKTPNNKRVKRDEQPTIKAQNHPIYHQPIDRAHPRYIIMHTRHKPGKKKKVWESDGYLTLVGPMAHLCDTKGRLLEEPCILDDIDLKAVEELGELLVGNTEVQVIELDVS